MTMTEVPIVWTTLASGETAIPTAIGGVTPKQANNQPADLDPRGAEIVR
jgi:hypothetical protein